MLDVIINHGWKAQATFGGGGVGGDSLWVQERVWRILSTYTHILLSLHTKKFFEPNNKHYFGVCVVLCVCTLGLRTLKGLGPPQS